MLVLEGSWNTAKYGNCRRRFKAETTGPSALVYQRLAKLTHHIYHLSAKIKTPIQNILSLTPLLCTIINSRTYSLTHHFPLTHTTLVAWTAILKKLQSTPTPVHVFPASPRRFSPTAANPEISYHLPSGTPKSGVVPGHVIPRTRPVSPHGPHHSLAHSNLGLFCNRTLSATPQEPKRAAATFRKTRTFQPPSLALPFSTHPCTRNPGFPYTLLSMGNVPAKETRSRALLVSSPANSTVNRNPRRHTTSTLIGGSPFLLLQNGLFGHRNSGQKLETKHKNRERHHDALVVRHTENVDGGFLAPFGIYRLNLDFDTEVVRDLVVARRLAPFYTPLQDFDDTWTPDEIFKLVQQLPLHALEDAYAEQQDDDDDIDDHKLHRLANYYKRQELKRKLQELVAKSRDQQRRAESAYVSAKEDGDATVASRDLVLSLYGQALECPICFLYFPPRLNLLRCCRQPICTECFVQIRRLDPHPPHDDPAAAAAASASASASAGAAPALPELLISEPACCPYCAVPDFGVTFELADDVFVGLKAPIPAGEYRKRASVETIVESDDEDGARAGPGISGAADAGSPTKLRPARRNRRMSVDADAEGVITTDSIRPDWQLKLTSARNKLARKAATASAIHASNLLIDDAMPRQLRTSYVNSLEDRMVQEAMRLLLLDEEERQRKG